MIFNEALQKVISNQGWVDKGSLWMYDGIKEKNEIIKLSDAQYLMLTEGDEGYFSIVHNGNGPGIKITVHHFHDPAKVYCETSFSNFKTMSSGDTGCWKLVPRYYVCGLTLNDKFDFHLLKIESGIITLQDDKIDWYTNGNFDFGYQGLTGVLQQGDELIFTVQRDGSLYRYSLVQGKIIDKVALAGRYGNAQPIIRNDKIWAVDYDTIVTLTDWKIERMKKLQKDAKGTSQFIGNLSFDSQKGLCIVPRPFSNDVIGINGHFRIQYTCNLEGQPLEAALMQNQTVVARDWKTGKLLKGQMKRKWF